MHKLVVTEIGDELGIILPPEIAEWLNAMGATELIAEETDRGFIIHRHDPNTSQKT